MKGCSHLSPWQPAQAGHGQVSPAGLEDAPPQSERNGGAQTPAAPGTAPREAEDTWATAGSTCEGGTEPRRPLAGVGGRPALRTDNPGGRVRALRPDTPPLGVSCKKRAQVPTEVCPVGGRLRALFTTVTGGVLQPHPAGWFVNASSSLRARSTRRTSCGTSWDALGGVPSTAHGGTEAMKSLGC